MKRLFLLFLCALLVLTGCARTDPLDVDPVEEVSSNTMSVTISSDSQVYTMDIPVYRPWTWNDLYDFLENPNKSGNLSFDAEKGEWVDLLDTDGVTSVKDQWTLPLEQNMIVVKYNANNQELFRYRINLIDPETSQTVSSKPVVSKPISSAPAPSEPASSGSSSSTSTSQKKTLLFYIGQNDSALEELVAQYNKTLTGVEILAVRNTSAMTADQLAEYTEENNTPDLILMNHREMYAAANRGLLTDLSTLGMDKWASVLDPNFLTKTAINGTYYGTPLGAITSCLASNETILDRAGVGVPTTFDELVANAKKIKTALPGITPIGLTTDTDEAAVMAEEFSIFLNGFGGQLLSEDYKTATFNTEAGFNTLNLYKQLKEEDLLSDFIIRKDLYDKAIAYSVVTSTNYSKTFGSQAKANYTASALPAPGNKTAASYMDLYSFCVPATGDAASQKIIADFLTYFYNNTQNSVTVCRKKGLVPAHLKAQTDKVYDTDAWKVFIDATKTSVIAPDLYCYPTIEGYLAEAISTVLSGGDVQTALDKAYQKTTARLARNN